MSVVDADVCIDRLQSHSTNAIHYDIHTQTYINVCIYVLWNKDKTVYLLGFCVCKMCHINYSMDENIYIYEQIAIISRTFFE